MPDLRPWTPHPTGRIPELDGIRGLAITLVLILHYFVVPTPSRIALYFRLAGSGVDLFFVLSGFLIAGILLDAKQSPSYYKTFYFRRFYRIIPLYAIWLAIFVIGVFSVGPSSPLPLRSTFNGGLGLWTYFLFLQNFSMAKWGAIGASWMGITWSLAVEEQFYLLLPLVVRRLSGRALLQFALGMIFVAFFIRVAFHLAGAHEMASLVLLPCRADAFGLGILVALAYRNQSAWSWFTSHRRYLYTAFIILGAGVVNWTLRDFKLMEWLGFTWMALFYTCLLLLVLANPGRVERAVFGNRAITRLGTIAYGVYLLHTGILFLCHFVCFHEKPTNHSPATVSVTIVSLLITIVLAELSWRYLEKPLIRMAHAKYFYAGDATANRVTIAGLLRPQLKVKILA
jgi:peptidoglycan/LPS O-acetylase OafA/YrhL